MKYLLIPAALAATFVAAPALAQDRVDVGTCIQSDTLASTIRRTQELTQVTTLECDRAATVGDTSTYWLGGREVVAFEVHLEGDQRMIDTIIFPGRPRIDALKGVCISGEGSGDTALICSATYMEHGERVAIIAAMSGHAE